MINKILKIIKIVNEKNYSSKFFCHKKKILSKGYLNQLSNLMSLKKHTFNLSFHFLLFYCFKKTGVLYKNNNNNKMKNKEKRNRYISPYANFFSLFYLLLLWFHTWIVEKRKTIVSYSQIKWFWIKIITIMMMIVVVKCKRHLSIVVSLQA